MNDNVVTMFGHKVRTVEDVIHELNEMVAAGEVKGLLVVITRPNSHRSVDWSNMSMADFVYSSTIVQHNMLGKLGEVRYDED